MDEAQVRELGKSLDEITAAAVQEAKAKGVVTRARLRAIHEKRVVDFVREKDLKILEWRIPCYMGNVYGEENGDSYERPLSEEVIEKIKARAALHKTYLTGGLAPRPKVHYVAR